MSFDFCVEMGQAQLAEQQNEIQQLTRNLRIARDRLERTKKCNAQALVWLRCGYTKRAVDDLEKGQRV